MSQRARGVLLGYVALFNNLLIGLAFTPFLVRTLGKAEYGLYVMVGSLVGHMTVLDLGLTDTVVRYVARYRARQDREAEERLLGLGLTIHALLAAAAVLLGVLIYMEVPDIFGHVLDPGAIGRARLMVAFLVVNVAMSLLFNSVTAALVAYEQFVVLRALEILGQVTTTIGIITALLLGQKALAVVIVSALVNVILIGARIIYALARMRIRFRFDRPGWPYVREFASQSLAVFGVVIVEQIYWKLDNVILGVMLGPSAVAVYSIGLSFHKYFMSFGTAISRVMFPTVVSKVEAGANGSELTDLLITVSRLQATTLMLMLTGLVLFGQEFIVLWLGPGYEQAYYVMLATLCPYSLELVGNVRNMILQAKGLYWHRTGAVFALAVANVPLTIALVSEFGMIGAAVATGLGIVVGYLAVNRVIQRSAGVELARYFRASATGLAPAIVLSMTVGLFLRGMPGETWFRFGAKVGAYTVVYVLFVWLVGLSPAERQLLARRTLRRLGG